MEIDRRGLLTGFGGLGVAATIGATSLADLGATPRALAAEAPALVRSGRPRLTHGVQSGDPTRGGGIVWARADRTARMLVEVSRDPSFDRSIELTGPVVTKRTDLTGRLPLRHLPPGREMFYRVTFADPDRPGTRSEPVVGRLLTAPIARRDIRFVWSGDMVGQGWGINDDVGGITIFERIRERRPDFFLHSGDSVYADGPLEETVTLPDGRTWRNRVTEPKSKVAETLAEYRGQFAYNLLDANVRRCFADVPQLNQWDDHEVVNNWYPGEILDDDNYTERRVDVLASRARRAFFEWMPLPAPGTGDGDRDEDGRIYRNIPYGPDLEVFMLDMRTHKDANSPGLETRADGGVFGWKQLRWLEKALRRSRATWKVVAADLPIGLVVPDGDSGDLEGLAQGDAGKPKGRELEVAWLLERLRRHRVRNVVWLTADVHYTAAHHYSPDRARFQDFDPFWEFVSGPLHAGAFGPNELDPTFGPKAEFVHAPPRPSASPLEGWQHFGEVEISERTRELTVHLRDHTGAALYTKTLEPAW